MTLRNTALIALLGASLAGGPALAKERVETVETRPERLGPGPCVTGEEVEALALVMMPEALTAVAQACTASLPESALLRRTGAPIFERYRAQSAPSMARAQAAFAKISGSKAKDVSEIGMETMKAMVVPMLTQAVEPKDCGAINHMIELLEPLPPENMAGMIATILQLVARKEEANRQLIETAGPEAKSSSPNVCPFPEAP